MNIHWIVVLFVLCSFRAQLSAAQREYCMYFVANNTYYNVVLPGEFISTNALTQAWSDLGAEKICLLHALPECTDTNYLEPEMVQKTIKYIFEDLNEVYIKVLIKIAKRLIGQVKKANHLITEEFIFDAMDREIINFASMCTVVFCCVKEEEKFILLVKFKADPVAFQKSKSLLLADSKNG